MDLKFAKYISKYQEQSRFEKDGTILGREKHAKTVISRLSVFVDVVCCGCNNQTFDSKFGDQSPKTYRIILTMKIKTEDVWVPL